MIRKGRAIRGREYGKRRGEAGTAAKKQKCQATDSKSGKPDRRKCEAAPGGQDKRGASSIQRMRTPDNHTPPGLQSGSKFVLNGIGKHTQKFANLKGEVMITIRFDEAGRATASVTLSFRELNRLITVLTDSDRLIRDKLNAASAMLEAAKNIPIDSRSFDEIIEAMATEDNL